MVRRHQSPVRGLLRQLVRADLELADDLAQETFIRAYKNIRSFRGEAKFSTWLYRIAYNVFRENARKRKELVGIDEEQLQSEVDPQTTDPGLRDETPYIDDAGFTARVMQQLPHRRFSWSAQRAFIIFAATIVSVVIAYFASGEGMFVHDAFARMSGLKPVQLLLLILACGTGMTIAGLWAALTRTRDMTI